MPNIEDGITIYIYYVQQYLRDKKRFANIL